MIETSDGNATIDFTGRGVPEIPPFSTTPVTSPVRPSSPQPPPLTSAPQQQIDRAVTIDEIETSVDSPPSSGAQHPGQNTPPDPEAMYEEVLSRLRRDLVAELEQSGQLLHDHL